MKDELLMQNESYKQIEPFRKIRKYVHRAGRRLECVPTEFFKKSLIVEIMNVEFDRLVDVDYWTLQFSRI